MKRTNVGSATFIEREDQAALGTTTARYFLLSSSITTPVPLYWPSLEPLRFTCSSLARSVGLARTFFARSLLSAFMRAGLQDPDYATPGRRIATRPRRGRTEWGAGRN